MDKTIITDIPDPLAPLLVLDLLPLLLLCMCATVLIHWAGALLIKQAHVNPTEGPCPNLLTLSSTLVVDRQCPVALPRTVPTATRLNFLGTLLPTE